MRNIQGVGSYVDVVGAPSPEDPERAVKFGIRAATFREYQARGLFTAVAQYYGIVQDHMGCARHLFEGLKRPLMLGDDMHADESVFIYTWRYSVDFEWHGSRQDGFPVEMVPPAGRVFAVLVRREEPGESGCLGSIEKWNWIKEDPRVPEAPIGWAQRYEKRLWSR